VLSVTETAAVPAGTLTGLFERARYSRRPIDESMRAQAVAALAALQDELYEGAPA
jgi:hypothetical protein